MVQTNKMRVDPDPGLIAMHKDVYMPMIDTAEVVAKRYNISRDRQDEYSYRSQMRTAAAQQAGRVRRRDRAADREDGHGQQGDGRGHLPRGDAHARTRATAPRRRSRG